MHNDIHGFLVKMWLRNFRCHTLDVLNKLCSVTKISVQGFHFIRGNYIDDAICSEVFVSQLRRLSPWTNNWPIPYVLELLAHWTNIWKTLVYQRC